MFRIHNNLPGYYNGLTRDVVRGGGPNPAQKVTFPQGWQVTKIPMLREPQELDDKYSFALDVSGVNHQDIAVALVDEGSGLLVELEKEYQPFKVTHTHWDKAFGTFRRTFELPDDADRKKVFYQINDNQLEINIFKDLSIEPVKAPDKKEEPLRPVEL